MLLICYRRSSEDLHPLLKRSEQMEQDFPSDNEDHSFHSLPADYDNDSHGYGDDDYDEVDHVTPHQECNVNVLSRYPDYPFCHVKRDSVPDAKVSWEVRSDTLLYFPTRGGHMSSPHESSYVLILGLSIFLEFFSF